MRKNWFALLLWLFYGDVYAALVCTAITATPVNFIPTPFGAGGNQTQTSSITATCNGNANDTDLLVIGAGTHFSGATRQMFSATSGQFIPYTVRQPNNMPWGGDPVTGASNTLGSPYIISRGTTSVLAYVSVSIPANTPSGIYTDLVIVNSPFNANKTATFTVSLTIVNSCSISSPPTPINFGNAPAGAPGSAIASQTASLGITCANGLSYVWGADQGLHWSGTGRRMANSANFIAYDLMENGVLLGDSGMAAYGGSNTTTGINYRSGYTGNGSQQLYTISATVRESVIPSALGTYSDTVVYTVGW